MSQEMATAATGSQDVKIIETQVRERREQFAKDPGAVRKLLRTGSEAAREVAARTLKDVREAMHLDYEGILDIRNRNSGIFA